MFSISIIDSNFFNANIIILFTKSSLGKGHIRVDQILKMEICIMKSLCWHLNPPTPSIYVDIAIPLVNASVINEKASYEIIELSRYLVELAVCDAFFADKKPSSVAYAAMLVAMESLSTSPKIAMRIGSYQLDKSPNVTELCAERLRHVYTLAVSIQAEVGKRGAEHASPTSVERVKAQKDKQNEKNSKDPEEVVMNTGEEDGGGSIAGQKRKAEEATVVEEESEDNHAACNDCGKVSKDDTMFIFCTP